MDKETKIFLSAIRAFLIIGLALFQAYCLFSLLIKYHDWRILAVLLLPTIINMMRFSKEPAGP